MGQRLPGSPEETDASSSLISDFLPPQLGELRPWDFSQAVATWSGQITDSSNY